MAFVRFAIALQDLDAEVFRIDSGRILTSGPARSVLSDERSRRLNTLR